jgi:class 3 adenylate cyclase
VIISDSTRARLGDAEVVQPLGARALKNVEAAVALFRLR